MHTSWPFPGLAVYKHWPWVGQAKYVLSAIVFVGLPCFETRANEKHYRLFLVLSLAMLRPFACASVGACLLVVVNYMRIVVALSNSPLPYTVWEIHMDTCQLPTGPVRRRDPLRSKYIYAFHRCPSKSSATGLCCIDLPHLIPTWWERSVDGRLL